MPIIPFDPWLPDAADLGNPGAISVVNALPGLTSYKPIGQLVSVTNALDARPRGAIEALDASKNVYQYAGDAAKLYSLTSTTWSDVSKGGGYSTGTDEIWEFVRWKEKVLATNFTDDPQQITFGDANFADLTTDLKFRHIAVVKDFVVAGNTFDSTSGTVRDRVRWSAFNDETDWTVSSTTLSDSRDLKAGGGVQRIIGGEYGVILSEKSIFRMTFVGSPTVFQIDEVMPGTGCLSPGAVAILGGTVYFASDNGFVALSGGSTPTFIGAGKVDQFFRDDLDEDNSGRMSAVADPRSSRVFWAYPGSGNTSGRPNKIIVYDIKLDKWGYVEQELELIWRSGGTATTLEALDSISSSIDALTISLDDAQWKGGAPLLSAFDSSFQNGNFSGTPMTAILETRETEINQGFRTRLNSFSPLVDGGSVTARIGTRNRQSDDVSYTSSLTQSSTGRFTKRTNAKFHRFELTASGEWTDAIGAQVERTDAVRAEGRG